MTNKNQFTQDFARVWDAAIECATENTPRENEANQDMLSTASGLLVQSGIRAGKAWTSSCGASCQAHDCAYNMDGG
ncbi:MAG TPA: hypothetical protein VFD70_17125 [Anaerolineae bacterium]|nr:hypothetical protein [Anaerolineae bacterium]